MNGDPNGNSDSSNGLKRKYEAVESMEEDPVETDSVIDENNQICAICIESIIKEEDASHACPHSDKHDFHKECLTTYIDL